MGGPCGRDRDRLLSKHVIHDREVVHGKIPQHVDISLEQAEVDPDRVVVVELAQVPAFHQLLDGLYGTRVDECVVDHQHESALLRGLDELRRLL